jgi:hypothetical protein
MPPSPAWLRFKASMDIDYEKWREGEPYDIAALSDVTREEQFLLTDEICAQPNLDWRDVQALLALATPKALARVTETALHDNTAAGAEALTHQINEDGMTPEAERRVIELLANMQSMDGVSHRIYAICTVHITPAIREQLFRNAQSQPDPTMRYSSAAFLLHHAGHAETWYGLEPEIRPYLLGLNDENAAIREAALLWLRTKLDNPKS